MTTIAEYSNQFGVLDILYVGKGDKLYRFQIDMNASFILYIAEMAGRINELEIYTSDGFFKIVDSYDKLYEFLVRITKRLLDYYIDEQKVNIGKEFSYFYQEQEAVIYSNAKHGIVAFVRGEDIVQLARNRIKTPKFTPILHDMSDVFFNELKDAMIYSYEHSAH